MKKLFALLRQQARGLFSFGEDAAREEEVIEGIRQGIAFRGAKLWILILAVFVASLGLNTNSAAVIIGAMLISPLMGPIIGMGLGAGIYDFDLLRRSGFHYIVATLVSVVTATIYFLITPIVEAQSELLARTSPTIYDVLIALCGGLAGIIALSSRSERAGNVIPGVAIATALMPPLCTTGFGIATGNWMYAAGAFYLFIINTIFIATATFVGAMFIMKFHTKSYLDAEREKKVKRSVYAIVIVTVIPALVLTFGMVRESYFERRINNFIQQEMRFPATQVLSHTSNFSERSFSVVLIGTEIDSTQLQGIRDNLKNYDLADVTMNVMQGTANVNALHDLLTASRSKQTNNEALVQQMQARVTDLENKLQPYQLAAASARVLCDELKPLFPQVASLAMARGAVASATSDTAQSEGDSKHSATGDSTQSAAGGTTHSAASDSTQVIAIVGLTSPLSATDKSRLTQWMKQRTNTPNLRLVFEKVEE